MNISMLNHGPPIVAFKYIYRPLTNYNSAVRTEGGRNMIFFVKELENYPWAS